ncbi:MAG: FAD-dependent oxidoreductase, partial [Pseudomonadales bacterium]|nr:FAD-dependent oxidoreductase [Pseudomonadales bacterium]
MPEPLYTRLAQELLLPYENPETGKTEYPEAVMSYLDIMKNGLGYKTSSPQRVVIIGAGIAGMFAAKLLKECGHHVSIIEANDKRVGGRIKTFRGSKYFDDENQYAEAGAMRFPEIHPLVNTYLDDLGYGFETQQFYLVDVDVETESKALNQRVIRCNSFEQSKDKYLADSSAMAAGFEIESPSNSASDLLTVALNPVRDLYSDLVDGVRVNKPYDQWLAGWAMVIEKFDKYAMRDYLEQETDLTAEQIDFIGTIENLTSRMPLAFMHSFLGRSDINVGLVYRELKGGSHNLTDKIEARLLDMGVTFHMDHRVTHMDYFDGETDNHATAADPISIRSVSEEGEVNRHISADLAIVTVPFSSFRFVRTSPDLSYQKRRAIMELHYDAATKVLLEFNERWWEFSKKQWDQR